MLDMEDYDIVIVGASFAGLTLAHYLPKDYRVLIIDKKKSLDQAIESTGLITQATYDLLADFVDIEQFTPNKITTIAVVDPSYEQFFFSDTDKPWIYSTDTPALVKCMSETVPKNVRIQTNAQLQALKIEPGTTFPVSVRFYVDGVEKIAKTRFVVGADGVCSQVARLSGLSENKKFLAGFEKVFYGDITFGKRPQSCVYHFWFGEFSLGYGGWLSPTIINGKNAFRLGLAKHKKDIHEWIKINHFVKILQERGIIAIEPGAKEILHFSKLIPIGGALRYVYDDYSLLLGDAAGFCGAFAADGIKGAIVSGKVAAQLIPEYVAGNSSALKKYYPEIERYNRLMTYYRKQIIYRMVWDIMQSDRTFAIMFAIISRQKETFLNQFCDNKDKNKSLVRVILKFKNVPLLMKYSLYLFFDVLKLGWKKLRGFFFKKKPVLEKSW